MDTPGDPLASEPPPEPRDDPALGGDDDSSLAIPAPDAEPEAPVWTDPEAFPPESGDDRPAASEPSLSPAFEIDDRIDASQTIEITDGSRLVISIQALIGWTSGTSARVKLTSRTLRENPGNKVYALFPLSGTGLAYASAPRGSSTASATRSATASGVSPTSSRSRAGLPWVT